MIMKTITKYLLEIRKNSIIYDLNLNGWKIYTTFLFLFLFAIIIENIFYLSKSLRFATIISLSVILIAFFCWLMTVIIRTYNNSFKRYKLSNLAKITGELIFTKKDRLINAFQLEKNSNDLYSKDLREQFINETLEKLDSIKLLELFPIHHINKWKKITFVSLIIVGLAITLTWNQSVSSIYRWAHIKTEFTPPKPFEIKGKTKHINVLGGENISVSFEAKGKIPDSLFIEFTPIMFDSNIDSSILETAYLNDNEYTAELNEVYQNYQYRSFYKSKNFWQAWDEISSKKYSISVTDRPSINDFTLIISPPTYTGLSDIIQKANQAEIKTLKGSKIEINLRSNKELNDAELFLDGSKKKMNIYQKTAKYFFEVDSNHVFSIHLKDTRGIKNRNPIPFRVEMVKDISPNISVLQPPPIIELGGEQSIPIIIKIEDDFGFSNLQLAYEIQRPNYINVEPFISTFSIPIDDSNQNEREIKTFWDLKPLGLMPEDEVHFHFELYDNDIVTGPKKSITSTFIARLPSLNDLFHSFNKKEDQIEDLVDLEIKDIQKIKEKLEKTKLDLLKIDKDKIEWKDQSNLKETIDELEKQLSNFQSIAEQMSQLNNSGEKHKLFSEDLMNKFKELQSLIEEIFPPDMIDNMDWLKEAIEKMDKEEMLSAIENLSKNIDQVEQELDRFLDIFKRVKAEQEIDELRKRIKTLIANQSNIDLQIRPMSKQTNSSIFIRLAQEEKLIEKELENIRKSMNSSAKIVKDFSRKTAQQLEKLYDSEIIKESKKYINKTIKNLENNNPYDAMDNSFLGMNSMESLGKEIDKILSEFQKETTQDMAQKFRAILRDMISLSKGQESLENDTEEIPRNSPGLSNLANEQQVLQNQLKQTMNNTMSLSKETFLVSPEMGRKLGQAYAQMEASKNKLAERNGSASLNNQKDAMLALNEGAQTILKAIKQMQDSGSASGYNEFLKQMENLADQQSELNTQGSQLALGQLTASMQQSMMEQMLFKQKGIRQSLQKMIDEMAQKGNQGLGDLSGITNDMDQVLNDLNKKRFDRKTSQNQQRILSRMIDSQKSLTQRGYEEERKSKTAEQIQYTGPMGLPDDLGQRQSLIMNAMNSALKLGYSNDYQKMIRRYFNSLNGLEATIKPLNNQKLENMQK